MNKKYEDDSQKIYHERVKHHTERLKGIYEKAEREWIAAKNNFESAQKGSYMSMVEAQKVEEAHRKMTKARKAAVDKNTIDVLAQEDANNWVEPPNYAYDRGGGNNTKKTKRRYRKKSLRHRKKTARHRKKSLRHRKKSVKYRNNH